MLFQHFNFSINYLILYPDSDFPLNSKKKNEKNEKKTI